MPARVTGERRFPPPWKVEELEACFFVTDSTDQKLAYVYFEDEVLLTSHKCSNGLMRPMSFAIQARLFLHMRRTLGSSPAAVLSPGVGG